MFILPKDVFKFRLSDWIRVIVEWILDISPSKNLVSKSFYKTSPVLNTATIILSRGFGIHIVRIFEHFHENGFSYNCNLSNIFLSVWPEKYSVTHLLLFVVLNLYTVFPKSKHFSKFEYFRTGITKQLDKLLHLPPNVSEQNDDSIR